MMLLTSLMLLLLQSGAAQQQVTHSAPIYSSGRNTWLMFFSDTRLSKQWGVHAEAQVLRSHSSRSGLQNVIRAGANYYVTDILMLTGGYAYSSTFPDAGYNFKGGTPEHRIYQQIQLNDTTSRVQFQHRYRLEQRWVQFIPGHSTYLNRMRYQLRLAMPLIGRRITGGVPFVVVSDEVFLGFGRQETSSLIKQNRAYAGLGYQITRAASLEVGYLHQLVQLRQEIQYEVNENIQLSLCFHPDFRRALSTSRTGASSE